MYYTNIISVKVEETNGRCGRCADLVKLLIIFSHIFRAGSGFSSVPCSVTSARAATAAAADDDNYYYIRNDLKIVYYYNHEYIILFLLFIPQLDVYILHRYLET